MFLSVMYHYSRYIIIIIVRLTKCKKPGITDLRCSPVFTSFTQVTGPSPRLREALETAAITSETCEACFDSFTQLKLSFTAHDRSSAQFCDDRIDDLAVGFSL